MEGYVKVVNLSPNVVTIHIGSIVYTMMPKGFNDPETKRYDHCLMKQEHVYDQKTQSFLLSDPPRIKIILLKKIDTSAELEKALNNTLAESNQKIAEFKHQLNKMVTDTSKELHLRLTSSFENFGKQLDDLYLKMDNIREEAEKIIRVLEKFDASKLISKDAPKTMGKVPPHKVGTSVQNLFEN